MLIELSEFNIKIFIPLIYPVFKRIQDFSKKAYIDKDNQLFKSFRYFLSYTISFIPFLIIKLRTKKEKSRKEKSENVNPLEIEKIDNEEKEEKDIEFDPFNEERSHSEIYKIIKKENKCKKLKNIIFILSLCILSILSNIYRYLFGNKKYDIVKQSAGIFFEITAYILLSYLILKQKLYKHNYVSAGIIASILLILIIITLIDMDKGIILPSILFYFFMEICFGFYDILTKKYFIVYLDTPYFLMLVIGIINLFIILIVDLFVFFIKPDIEEIIFGFKHNISNVTKFFIFLSDIILEWIWNLGIKLTIYYLTPCHYFITDYINEFIYYVIEVIKKKTDESENDGIFTTVNIIIFFISFSINFFCCLVFNEVIILNFFGLDYNTKKRIQKRMDKDSEILMKINSADEQITKEEESDHSQD